MNMLSKTRLYGFDYAINPYIGCTHNCAYCYARFMCKYVNKRWGTFCIPKSTKNLKQELKLHEPGSILLSTVTDPYQETEAEKEVTREILEILRKFEYNVTILTKSPLVLRDVDVIKQLNAEVGVTIALTEEHARRFERNAPSIDERINALKKLKQEGVKTYVFIGPVVPFITDANRIVKLVHKYVDYILVDKLRIKHGNWQEIKPILKKHYSDYYQAISTVLFGKTDYYERIRSEVYTLCKHLKKHVWFCF